MSFYNKNYIHLNENYTNLYLFVSLNLGFTDSEFISLNLLQLTLSLN